MSRRIQTPGRFHAGILGRILFLSLLFALLLFIPHPAAQAGTVKKISFTDGSGKSLNYNGRRWILKDADGNRLTGVQYIKIKKQDKLHSGYYYFDEKGRLVQKRAVYYLNQKVNKEKFKGYYYANSNGRFANSVTGLTRLKNLSCNGKTFDGYYYVQKYGKLSADAQLRYVKKKTGGISFKGYYWFSSKGKLSTADKFRKVKQTVNGVKFKGSYYFGGKNGALLQKKGWITYRGDEYYLNSKGKMVTDKWKDGYYLLSNGKKAKSQKLPDGTYVDADGIICSKSDYKESSTLKSQVSSIISRYGGTWSVYAKNLNTSATITVNDCTFSSASTIKAFVMASTYDQIEKGKISETSAINSLLNNMITISDNESYNELVRRHSSVGSFTDGASVINSYLSANGYTKTGVHHTLHPSNSASTGDGGNTTSAKDCGLLLERIYNGTCVSKSASKKMLNLLLNQQRRSKIPSAVPSGVKVANKTGETSDLENDIAIVYGEKSDFVLCVFSLNCSRAVEGIKEITSAVYNYWN